jgi:hypothetical protein
MLPFELENPVLKTMLAKLNEKEVLFNPKSLALTGEYAAIKHAMRYYQHPATAIVLWNRPHPRWRKFLYKLKR